MQILEGRSFRKASLLFIPAVVILGLLWSAAQQPVPPQLPAPVLRVNTGLVLVNLVATDDDGNKVSDLSKDEIRLLEDGKEQEIAFLSLERTSLDETRPSPPPLPPFVHTNRPEYRAPTGPPTIILLDILNTSTSAQQVARLELLKFVDRQMEADRKIAVFTLGYTVRILQDFTDDPNLLRAAINEFKSAPSLQMLIEDVAGRISPQATTASPVDLRTRTSPGGIPYQQIRARAVTFLEEQAVLALDDRIRNTVNAFRLISQWAAGYPGRKNLIWVTGGVPKAKYVPVINLETGWRGGQLRAERVYERDLQEAVSLLSDAQVTVYSVDAKGLLAGSGLSVQAIDPGEFAMAHGLTSSDINKIIRAHDTAGTLDMVARDTGGLSFRNRNDIGNSVYRGMQDGSLYYLIGYYPKNKKLDGKLRKIEIKTDREGLDLRHRRGYYARNPGDWKKTVDDKDTGILTALQPGTPPAATVIFDTRVAPPDEYDKKAKIPVQFIVNADTLTYDGKPDGPRSYDLEFRAICYRPDGTIAAHAEKGVKATVQADQIPTLTQQGFPFYDMQIEVEPGLYVMAVAVRDNRSGNVGSAHFALKLDPSG